MNNGHTQPPPFFSVHIPAPGQVGVNTNITNPIGLLVLLSEGLRAYADNLVKQANKPQLAIANEIPRITGPLRGDDAQEVS